MNDTENNKIKKNPTGLNLTMIFGTTLMAVLGVASITPAFPDVIRKFQLSTGSIGLLITVFTFPGVVLTPLLGVLADRKGRKKILVPSLLLFGVSGAACGFAESFETMLVLRFFQGVGAAALGSLNVTLIGDLFSGPERGRMMGYNASVLSVGTAAYPLLGGLLAGVGWNYPFFLPVLSVPLGILILLRMENRTPENREALGMYLKNVIKNINIQVGGIFLASTATFLILYGSFLTYLPILVSHRFQGSAFQIGLLLSSMSLTTALTSFLSGRIQRFLTREQMVRLGFIFYGVSMAIVPMIPDYRLLFIPTLLFGMGQGLNIPSLQTILADIAPIEYRAAFMSANGTVLRTGQTLGPILAGLVFAFHGISGTFAFGGFTALFAILVSFFMIRDTDSHL